MLIAIIVIIGIVIYFVTASAKDEEHNKHYNTVIMENIELYNIVYKCMESAHEMAEDPSSLKKYLIFKRKILTSDNTFAELESHSYSAGLNRYLNNNFASKYNLNKILDDLMTIRNALLQSHDFQEFKNNTDELASSFKLLTQGGMTLDDIHKEHKSVVNHLRQNIQN